jgi:hypothetical protein
MNRWPNKLPEPMPVVVSAFAVDSFGGVAQLLSLGHIRALIFIQSHYD